ncbi:unnamed protein product [Spirodela intermedia]|uniref:ATP synthase F1 complex delta/epsilon subunit N-terminal domain-containing protein n=1 Tax=Spirodela intermedia TaxID=51605 RepID=A0A7I8IJ72_SPIIN|nr:unnamed protein product [Spirodela intermedia]CAA6657198.1 unnamed protein product [Spirodela intermedia]
MYRQARRLLMLRSSGGPGGNGPARSLSTGLPAAPAEDATFVEAWKKVAPNIEPPTTPLSFMKPRPATPRRSPASSPSTSCFPTSRSWRIRSDDGAMGVLPGHVPTIAELKPGVLSVHDGSEVAKYFVSSGFAFVHANSVTDIVAVEAIPVDQIDPALVQKGLAEFNQRLSSASTDVEKAEAQIGIDVHSALNAAVTG